MMLNKQNSTNITNKILRIIFEDFLLFVLRLGIINAGTAKNINTIINIDGNNIDIVLIKNVNMNVIFVASGFIENKHIALIASTTMKNPKKAPI